MRIGSSPIVGTNLLKDMSMTNVSNSKAMTIEDLLVQRLKTDTLYQLVGDEDALRELTTKALEKALFTTKTVYNDYTRETKELRSAVLQAAEVPVKELVLDVMKTLSDDPAFRELVRQAVLASIPTAIKEYSKGLVTSLLNQAEVNTLNQIVNYNR